ncbi:MAG: DUF3486 family protein [Burkholderiaceae bacterium]|nr:MAG: DUF3486 family protein [Burkholderiaceae bacterium]
MGRRSTVAALPKELLERCHALIREGYTIEEILGALQGMGAEVSRSAVGRYVKSARETFEKYRQAQEVAKVWVDKLEAEPAGDVGRLLPEMLRTVAFQTLTSMGEGEADAKPADIMLLARAIKDVAGATKTNIDVELQLRRVREQIAARADAAAKAAAKEMKQAGVSADTIAAIRQRILGVAAP